MSQPPSNFDPTATLLPRVDAPISVQTGGGYYDTKDGDSEFKISNHTKSGSSQVGGEYSPEEKEILQKYSIGSKLQTQIGESTLREFIKQIQTPKCSAGAGAGILLHKDCWAVQAVITHLLRASLPNVVRKSNINPDIRYQPIPASDQIDLSMEGFGGIFQNKDDSDVLKEVKLPSKKVERVVPNVIKEQVVESQDKISKGLFDRFMAKKKMDPTKEAAPVPEAAPEAVPEVTKPDSTEELLKLQKEQREREEIERRKVLERTLEVKIEEFIHTHQVDLDEFLNNEEIELLKGKHIVPEGETNYNYSIYIDKLLTNIQTFFTIYKKIKDFETLNENEKKFKTSYDQEYSFNESLYALKTRSLEVITFINNKIVQIPYTTHEAETTKIADTDLKLKELQEQYNSVEILYNKPIDISPQEKYEYILENIKLLPGNEEDNTTLRGRFMDEVNTLRVRNLEYQAEFTREMESLGSESEEFVSTLQPVDYTDFGKRVYDARMYLEGISTKRAILEEYITKYQELEQKFLDIQAKSKKANIRSSELTQLRDILTSLQSIQNILTNQNPNDDDIYTAQSYDYDSIKVTYETLQKRGVLTISEKMRNQFTRKNKNKGNKGNKGNNTRPNNGKRNEIVSRGQNIDSAEVSILTIKTKINQKGYKFPKFLKEVVETYYNKILSYQAKLVKRNINSFARQNIIDVLDIANALTDLFSQIDIFHTNTNNIIENQRSFDQKINPSEYERNIRQAKYNEATQIGREIILMPSREINNVDAIEQLKQEIVAASDRLYQIQVFLESDEAEREPEPEAPPTARQPGSWTPVQLRAFETLGIPEEDRANSAKYAKYYRKLLAKWHPDKYERAREGETEEEHQMRKEVARRSYQFIQRAYDIVTGQAGGKGKRTRRNRKTARKATKKHRGGK